MGAQGSKGFTPWSTNRKAKQPSHHNNRMTRKQLRQATQEAAHKENVASGQSPWDEAKALRARRRVA